MSNESNARITLDIRMKFNIGTILLYEQIAGERFDDYDPTNKTHNMRLVKACIYEAYNRSDDIMPINLDGIYLLPPLMLNRLIKTAERLRKKHRRLNPNIYYPKKKKQNIKNKQ